MPTSTDQNDIFTEFDQQNHESTDPTSFLSNLNPPPRDDSSWSFSAGMTSEDSRATLQYISEMLMEEELESRPCMLQDCLALQAAEKSLEEVLVQQHPSPINPPPDSSIQLSVENSNYDFINHSSESSNASRSWDDGSGWISFKNDHDDSTKGSRSQKDRHWEDGGYLEEDGRISKQSTVYADGSEPPDMLDEVLLSHYRNPNSDSCSSLQLKGGRRGSNGKRTGKKKKDDNREVVDFQALLTQCAKSVASYDRRTANELLKQIRQHSSPYGDGNQRVAHYLANGLEQRLAAAVPSFNPLCLTSYSAADILKGYQTYIKACPFKLMSCIYANKTIIKLAEKATRLHIIDFGILYGYQWPGLIQSLAERSSGPPMLRITGIEFPQPGFRPSQRIEETGHRLAKYCKRFNVPFEYNFIAQDWETIRYQDIKLERDELTVVNCLCRLRSLPEETETNSPRDNVLKLIRSIDPHVYIHGLVHGTYNTPFFTIRFQEALHHFSSMFDIFDETLPIEDQQRLLYEQEMLGRDIINVIACEGSRRLERPETYKQWQIRNTRAGFKQLPSNQEILTEVRNMVKLDYHEDFFVDEDGKWIVQGWKGRTLHAFSCWKPAS